MAESNGVSDRERYLTLEATDVTGTKVHEDEEVRADMSVGEVVTTLVSKMSLPTNDPEGRQVTYGALLDRENQKLNSSETIGDVARNGDRLVLAPRVNAG